MTEKEAHIIIDKLDRIEQQGAEAAKRQLEQYEQFILLRAAVESLHKRVDKHEAALEGNVTTKVLRNWVIGTATMLTAIGTIFAAAYKVFIK